MNKMESNIEILKARIGQCWNKKLNITLFNLEFKAANSRFYRGFSSETFETKAEADQALKEHNSGENPFSVSAIHTGGSYFMCRRSNTPKQN